MKMKSSDRCKHKFYSTCETTKEKDILCECKLCGKVKVFSPSKIKYGKVQ